MHSITHESSQAYDWTFSYTSAWIAYMIGIADGFVRQLPKSNSNQYSSSLVVRKDWVGVEPTTSAMPGF
jgi:hypothetical protein